MHKYIIWTLEYLVSLGSDDSFANVEWSSWSVSSRIASIKTHIKLFHIRP